MSTKNNTTDANSDKYSNQSDGYFTSHFQQGGRHFLYGPEGERVNLARLTAYAEYGEEVYGTAVHHEIPLLKIDAPRFLQPLPAGEHARLHNSGSDPVEVEGFPLLRRVEGVDG